MWWVQYTEEFCNVFTPFANRGCLCLEDLRAQMVQVYGSNYAELLGPNQYACGLTRVVSNPLLVLSIDVPSYVYTLWSHQPCNYFRVLRFRVSRFRVPVTWVGVVAHFGLPNPISEGKSRPNSVWADLRSGCESDRVRSCRNLVAEC